MSLHHLPKMSEVNSYTRKSALTIVIWSEPLKIVAMLLRNKEQQ